jgi:ACR3 family arsenite transporter
MVIIWNDLACGDREAAAVLIALNSVFQVIAFGALGWFYLQGLPGWLGLATDEADFSVGKIVVNVLVFLGVPLAAGYLTRRFGERARGRAWYEERFLPRIGPVALYGLLFTVVILFALQGDTITGRPADVARIALPLLAYFALMWGGSFALGRLHRRREQLRAGDRRRHRHLRRHLRAGPVGRGRPADRGSSPGRSGVPVAVAASPIPTRGAVTRR